MSILTTKFGGTSVGSVEALQQAAAIIQDQTHNWEHVVVVVSAMSGVTNALLASAKAAAEGDEKGYTTTIDDIHYRHQETIRALLPKGDARTTLETKISKFIQDLRTFCHSIHVMGEVTPRGTDSIASLGERMNARVFAALLDSSGTPSIAVDATELIVTDDHFMDAAPLMDLTRARIQKNLLPLLEKGLTPVVTGFVSATKTGITTTLGRGGSDYTSAILGDCLDADEVWTYTDVDGVMTADPRIVPAARVVPELSYSEVSEMAYFGAKVLHPKTIRPIIERGIPLWVKNTFNPSFPGTRIAKESNTKAGMVTAITTIRNLSIVNVEGRGMLGVPGIAARTFAAVAREGASVLMISQSSSEQSICFIIPTESAAGVLRSIEEEMALELMRRDIDRIWAQEDVEILTVIGSGMRDTPGVSARVFGALGRENINVIAIAQGSSEFSISMVVTAEDATRAVQAIHAEVVEKNGK
ncbi:MAG: aspartate kinase [Anaerolineaceae bacterium]|nr:aspartate kinase [Anaerolineaceae bacterium]